MRQLALSLFLLLAAVVRAGDVNDEEARCEACVAVATALCHTTIGYRDPLPASVDPAAPVVDEDLNAAPRAIAENALDAVCASRQLEQYVYPASVLRIYCGLFTQQFRDDVVEFFTTIHRQEKMTCARAVDVVCASITEVCEHVDTSSITTPDRSAALPDDL